MYAESRRPIIQNEQSRRSPAFTLTCCDELSPLRASQRPSISQYVLIESKMTHHVLVSAHWNALVALTYSPEPAMTARFGAAWTSVPFADETLTSQPNQNMRSRYDARIASWCAAPLKLWFVDRLRDGDPAMASFRPRMSPTGLSPLSCAWIASASTTKAPQAPSPHRQLAT